MNTTRSNGFAGLGLPLNTLSLLDKLGFTVPTPIQEKAIPVALKGRDLMGIAQTGTGKTLAFGLPIVARLRGDDVALVLAPTRELAQQIEDTFRALGARTALLIGGASMSQQVARLRSRPSVIVATPGRLIDHLDRRTAELRSVRTVVLDEADRMLDMGFAPAIRRILESVPIWRQTMLFSATMPPAIADLSQRFMVDAVRVEVTEAGAPADSVEQELLVVNRDEKKQALSALLTEHKGTVLVFARTRRGAAQLCRTVRTFGHTASELHSDRTLSQRREALQGFKQGTYRVLVATDIAARGIDVKEIGLVINFDVPEHANDYIHRIGRTGRAGAKGRAILIATPDQHSDVRAIEKLMRIKLPRSPRSKPILEASVKARGSRRAPGR